MREARAVVFDLDDTLYPYRAFVGSGFRAVAEAVERMHGIATDATLRTLRAARAGGDRGRELQRLCEVCALPPSSVATLRDVLRGHVPSLRLPRTSRAVLERLRRDWRLGVLTNGTPSVQARKIAALGLAPFLDAVVFASDYGDGGGKPAPEGFEVVLSRLGVAATAAVFVGNDPVADIGGAAAAGFRTIHMCRPWTLPGSAGGPCDARVTSLLEVPALAARLVGNREPAHVV